MMNAWFDPIWFGPIYCAVLGGLGGAIFGIVVGAIPHPPQTDAQRARLFGAISLIGILAAANLLIGLIAFLDVQPWGIAWPFTLLGLSFSMISICVGFARLRSHGKKSAEFHNDP